MVDCAGPTHKQIIRRSFNLENESVDVTLKGSGLIFGRDYDEVDDTTLGLVQTILLKLDSITVQTVTITYTNSCKDQYNMVVT